MLFICSCPHVLSLTGGLYCCSASELVECSVSARQAAPGFSVPLKEGMRPAPVVEETEVVEAGKDEKPAEETAVASDEGKASQEQPVYASVLFVLLQSFVPNTHRRRRRDETVLSRRVGGVYMNSRRLPTDSAMRTHNAAVGRDPVHDCRRVCSHWRHDETVAN